ncbi:VTT domain-containing protein [bacterium]|nr:VTT domain-containing protein [bacterium]
MSARKNTGDAPAGAGESALPRGWPSRRVRLVAGFVLVAACVAATRIPAVREMLSWSWIAARIGELNALFHRPYGVPLFVVISTILPLFQIPGLVMVILAAIVFDPVAAFAWGYLGALLGCLAPFYVSRYFLRDALRERLSSGRVSRVLDAVHGDAITSVIVLRIVFFMSPPLSWALGVTRIGDRDHFIGNALGLVPVVAAVQVTVRALKDVKSVSDIFQPRMIAFLVVAAVVVIVVAIAKRRLFPRADLRDDTQEATRAV